MMAATPAKMWLSKHGGHRPIGDLLCYALLRADQRASHARVSRDACFALTALFVLIGLLAWYVGEAGAWKLEAYVAAVTAALGIHYLAIASETEMLVAEVLAEDDRQERTRELGRWIDRQEAAKRDAQSADATLPESA